MFIRIISSIIAAAFLIVAASTQAGAPVSAEVFNKLRATLEVPSTGLKVGSASISELPGLYEVQFINGPLVYSTASGDYFLVGDIFSVGPAGFVNLAEKRRDGERIAKLEAVKVDDMIVFPAIGETRTVISVFTDVSCFYCQKLHKEVPALNQAGVEVRYLAYPRAGAGSEAFNQLASAWCAADKQATLTLLKNRKTVPTNVCADNPIAAQYLLGQQMGVRGTPAIVTASGQMIPGYRSADELVESLGLN
jgi:thiol:disulfide interchange protein DsbC